MKTITIGAHTYRKLDDASAMRLLRAFFAIVAADDAAGSIAFWETLASHLVSPHNRDYIQMIRRQLGAAHPECAINERAHWLVTQLGQDTGATRTTIATLCRIRL